MGQLNKNIPNYSFFSWYNGMNIFKNNILKIPVFVNKNFDTDNFNLWRRRKELEENRHANEIIHFSAAFRLENEKKKSHDISR